MPAILLALFARCAEVLKPPPRLTLSQWADKYRMLSPESSAEPGRWHTGKAPYQREIMDAIGDPHIPKVVIKSAAQIGKTDIILNAIGYYMKYAPAPIMNMQPTLDMGQTFSKDRLAPMLRDTPVLRDLVDTKSRYAGNTICRHLLSRRSRTKVSGISAVKGTGCEDETQLSPCETGGRANRRRRLFSWCSFGKNKKQWRSICYRNLRNDIV